MPHKGKHHSVETRNRMSEIRKGQFAELPIASELQKELVETGG